MKDGQIWTPDRFLPKTVPLGWRTTTLQALAARCPYAFVDGPFGSSLKNEEYEDTGVPLIQLNNIRIGVHDLTNLRFVSEAKAASLAKHKAKPGDIVIAKMADPVARAAIVSEAFPEYIIVADCIKLSVDINSVDTRLLTYCINAPYVRATAEALAVGTGRLRTNLSTVRKLQVCLPPLPEQRAIADFLDRKTQAIDALIQKKERLIALLQEKRQALITQAVTKGLDPIVPMKDSGINWLGKIPAHWQLQKVKHLVSFVTSGSRGWSDYFSDDGPLFLQSGNLNRQLGLDLSNIQHVQPPKGAEGTRTRVRKDDVLVCITGALTGNVSHVHSDIGEAYVNQHLALVRPKRAQIQPRLLAHALASDFGQHQFWMTQYGGTKQGLGLQDVRDVILPIPPQAEQSETLAKLETCLGVLLRLRNRIDDQILKLREYRQALISAAVTGKIDVTKETV